MAEWKKLVVSGSNISQLNNDAGYLTAGTITQANGYATASVNGTELIAASSTSSLTFASSSGQGVTLVGSSPGGLNTITVGLSSIPNTSLANSGSIIGDTVVNLGTTVTTLTGLTSVTATNFTGTASYATLATTALSANSATSASYALTSSFALNTPNAGNALTASNITPAITNEANNRVLTANGGGTINGEANLTFDGTNLILNGNQTISGDLTVNGTTTTINTANLNIADKFILLSSGSTSTNDGGIIIQNNVDGTGFAFLYDQGQARWAYTGSLSSTATTASPDAFAAMVVDLNVAESTDKVIYQKPGNIKIATNQDIFIWA
jgi:hypothetical protein